MWKESLNSNGKQFHQHQQQNEQPALTSNNQTQEKTTDGVGNPCPGLCVLCILFYCLLLWLLF